MMDGHASPRAASGRAASSFPPGEETPSRGPKISCFFLKKYELAYPDFGGGHLCTRGWPGYNFFLKREDRIVPKTPSSVRIVSTRIRKFIFCVAPGDITSPRLALQTARRSSSRALSGGRRWRALAAHTVDRARARGQRRAARASSGRGQQRPVRALAGAAELLEEVWAGCLRMYI